jgi:hypothetical protein
MQGQALILHFAETCFDEIADGIIYLVHDPFPFKGHAQPEIVKPAQHEAA